MKKLVSLLLVAIMALSLCSISVAEEKVTLKLMNMYQTYNFEEQYAHGQIEAMTGYDIEWYMLPQENGAQQLVLQVAAGEEYDMLLNMPVSALTELQSQGLLMPLNDLLDEYFPLVYEHVSDAAWATATDEDGVIYSIPRESANPNIDGTGDQFGAQNYGLLVNVDKLKALNLELPTTIDEFYAVCKAYTEATGNPALSLSNNPWETNVLMPAFGMGAARWYGAGDEFVHRLDHPGVVAYIEFMQKLYAEGLLDADFPLNSSGNVRTKFTNGTCLFMVAAFWDHDSNVGAFNANNNGVVPELTYLPAMKLAEDDKVVLYRTAGINYANAIPYNSKHPVDAMKYLAIISTDEAAEAIYVGQEGVHHEKRNGTEYWPLYPDFTALQNSDKFMGVAKLEKQYQMWMARARKTETIGAAFADINSDIYETEVRYFFESYAQSNPDIAQNESVIDTKISDTMLALIVEGGDVPAAIAQLKADLEEENWTDYCEAYAEWYAENTEAYYWTVK